MAWEAWQATRRKGKDNGLHEKGLKRRAWRALLLLTLALRFPPLQVSTLPKSAHFTQPVMNCPCPIPLCPPQVTTLQDSSQRTALVLTCPCPIHHCPLQVWTL